MKTTALTAKLLSLVALMLVVVMAFTACGDDPVNTESDSANADVTSVEDDTTEDTSSTEDTSNNGSSKKNNSNKN